MDTKQVGFTLIELVMVIVILGILAAVAVPKFVDLQTDARIAATKGVAGGVSSAFAVNYAAYVANSTKGTQIAGAAVTVSAAANSIMAGGIPTGYTVGVGTNGTQSSTVNCGASVGLGISITVSNGTQDSAATLICTG